MISDKVLALAVGFCDFWSNLLKDSPKYRLDHSWPSVGTVDLALSSFYNKPSFNDNELNIINGAAAYLGGMLHDVWIDFAPQIEVSLTATANNEVTIKAAGAKLAPKHEPFELEISKALISILSKPRNPFPCFSEYARSIGSRYNRISLFALGAIAGLCPYGKGKWATATPEDVPEHLNVALKFLSESAAQYYKNCYPAETLGANPLLYQAGLIFPPTGLRELYPLQHAVHGIIKFFEHVQASRDQMINLCYNLALSPDSRIAETGLVISMALCSSPVPNELRLLVETFQGSKDNLRTSLLFARRALGKPDNWMELLAKKSPEEARELFNCEVELGLFPDLVGDFDLISKDDLAMVVSGIVFGKFAEVRGYIDKLSAKGKLSAPIILQGIALDIKLGQLDRAEQEILNMEAYLPTDINLKKRFYELSGLLHIMRGRFNSALESLKKAHQIAAPDIIVDVDVVSHYSSALLFTKNYSEVLELTDKAKKSAFMSFISYFNRLQALLAINDNRYPSELQHVARKLPFNHNVFSLILNQRKRENI
ncbi:MAG: hypothetical protein IT292_04080 [Deltaproteobacteria bacterium]|nr:hypothetical protein [Deltaproteobacteria bacterium]